jgi:hypothetical protein
MSKTRYKVEASSTTRTYVYCWIGARKGLKQAEAVKTGSFYFRMMAGVFAAFAVEAFLNHAGQKKIREWKELERRLAPREKLILLRYIAGWSYDESRRPFQTLRQMLRLRDALAHGKTIQKNVTVILEQLPWNGDELPEPEWKKLCSFPMVKRMVDDAEAIIRDLAKQSGFSGDPFRSGTHGSIGFSS